MFQYNVLCNCLKDLGCKSLLDVGANTGYWADDLARVWKMGGMSPLEMMCIEANPGCEELLKTRGIPYKILTLSDSKKKVKFFTNEQNNTCSGHSYYMENSSDYNEETFVDVKATTLDEVFKDRTFDAIKIDTQGSELDILRGGPGLLERAKLLIVEVNIGAYNLGAPHSDEVSSFFEANGWGTIGTVGRNSGPAGELLGIDVAFIKK